MSASGDRQRSTSWTVVRALHRLLRFIELNPEQQRAQQLASLQRLVEAASRTAPYRELYGGRPEITDLDDLSALPTTSRTHLARFTPAERVSTDRTDLVPQPSTGTTGETMVSMRSPEEASFQDALGTRQWLAQKRPTDGRHLVLHFALGPDDPLEVNGNSARISGWAPIEAQAEAVRSFRPTSIAGAPSGLIELADYTGGFPVEGLTTFGEVLTPADRAELRRFYGAESFDLYSASESGHISWQCSAGSSYHINSDAVLVEIADEEGHPVPPGDSGQILLTSMWNTTNPIVRYRIADYGSLVPEPCPCGLNLPLMAQVEGREVDRPIAYDGRRVSPMRFALAMVGPYHDRMRRWRVIQREVGDILVEVVWVDQPVDEMQEKMAQAFSENLGGPVDVEVRSVPQLAKRGRKFRWVESLVK